MQNLRNLSDSELNALIAQQSAASNPLGVGIDINAPAPPPNPLVHMSDLDLDRAIAAEYAKKGNGQVINSETRQPATEAQTAYYQRALADGTLDQNAEWGTSARPLLGVQGRSPTAGQYFVDAGGVVRKVPDTVVKDQLLGFYDGGMKPINAARGAVEDGMRAVLGAFTPEGYENPVDTFNQWSHDNLGWSNGIKGAREDHQRLMELGARVGHVPGKVGQFGGNVFGTIPLMMVAPEGLAGAAIGGGLTGLALSDHRDAPGLLGDALGGAAGGSILHGFGKVVASPVITDPAKQLLNRTGIPLTTGQMLGYGEDFLSRFVPNMGKAEQRAMAAYTPSAANHVLAPLGVTVPKGSTGLDALNFTRDVLENAVNSAKTPAQLTALREAAARYAPFKAAVRSSSSEVGNFTPGELMTAVRARNPLADVATAPMYDYASAGVNVLGAGAPKTYNGAMGVLGPVMDTIASVAPQFLGSAANVGFKGTLTKPLAFGAGLYTRPAQAAIRSTLMDTRPDWMKAIGQGVQGAPSGGLFGSGWDAFMRPTALPEADFTYPGQYYPGQEYPGY